MRDSLKECVEFRIRGENRTPIIKPNSVCIYNNEKVTISEVVNTEKGLKYRFTYTIHNGVAMKLVSIHDVTPIDEESEWGYFNFETYLVED